MSSSTLAAVRKDVRGLASPPDAEFLLGFFKTGPGQYGEGDKFLGIRVPQLRQLARTHESLPHRQVVQLLRSRWHEERLLALLLMVGAYKRADASERDVIHQSYLDNTEYINNWDLVDASAEHIVGPHLDPRRFPLLGELAASDSLWERRIAIVAPFHWIRKGVFKPTLHVAKLLVNDSHDLIHKAVGWMLREVGKRDQDAEEAFLQAHYQAMPRTMLRYAIERLPEMRRLQYLHGEA